MAAAYVAKTPEMMQTIPRELLERYTDHRDLFTVDEHVMQVKRAVLAACANGNYWTLVPISFTSFPADVRLTQNKISNLFFDCDVHWCNSSIDDDNNTWDVYVNWKPSSATC